MLYEVITPNGRIFAVERNEQCRDFIKANLNKFRNNFV